MASALFYYEEEDPDIREIVERMQELYISQPKETQMKKENTGTKEEVLGDKLVPICRLVDDLVKCNEDSRCLDDEIIRRGRALEEIMLSHEENLIRENEFLFLLKIGQLYSMTKKDKKPAIDALSRVVEKYPNVAPAWDALADCYWEVKDYDKAKWCLENSLQQGRRKVPLRNMSVICRKLANKYPDRKPIFLQTGLNLAKEAVDKDIKDGVSWGILGNAYLSAHLKLKKDMKCAKLALSAFKQSIYTFCENYKEALTSLDNAIALRKVREQAIKFRNVLLLFLNNIQNLCSCYGKLNPKRLSKLQKELQKLEIASLAKSLEAEPTSVGSLQLGENPKMFVCGKVIWSFRKEEFLPFACGCIEANGEVFVITVYNLTPGKKIFVGDTITIPILDYKTVCFEYKDQFFEFQSLRVDNPTVLLVNQERLTQDYFTQQ
ncbi:tetratricopeptide repeat protein 5-like isoform X2 [Rhodnius prolixus]|uniref:tetratricopeptide repeat protein 5-like isoform X2 n=1 Tax=Rhodnius prolixus TaxID=13249 RepID=UPI003D18E274